MCSLTHELLDVEVQKDLEPSGILCRRMGPNLMLFMSQRDALCVAVTWKPYVGGGKGKRKKEGEKNTIISLPWNQFECWPLQCCNYLGHADTFPCSVHWTCARCSEHLQKQFYFWGKNVPLRCVLCARRFASCSHGTIRTTLRIFLCIST